MLSKIEDGDFMSLIFSTVLTSPVLVTGALLVSTGDCRVIGNIISINESVKTPSFGRQTTNTFYAILQADE